MPIPSSSTNRSLFDVAWRIALLLALGWIAWELHRLHDDLNQPLQDDTSTVASGADDNRSSLDDVRDDIADLTQKVDAIMIVMARSK